TAMTERLYALGLDSPDIQRLLRTFNANADAFRDESNRHGD
ncbi:MAG: oxidoreductase, partial [Kangiella sp.]|nr:oxidoreductase [Kangiella sp.]